MYALVDKQSIPIEYSEFLKPVDVFLADFARTHQVQLQKLYSDYPYTDYVKSLMCLMPLDVEYTPQAPPNNMTELPDEILHKIFEHSSVQQPTLRSLSKSFKTAIDVRKPLNLANIAKTLQQQFGTEEEFVQKKNEALRVLANNGNPDPFTLLEFLNNLKHDEKYQLFEGFILCMAIYYRLEPTVRHILYMIRDRNDGTLLRFMQHGPRYMWHLLNHSKVWFPIQRSTTTNDDANAFVAIFDLITKFEPKGYTSIAYLFIYFDNTFFNNTSLVTPFSDDQKDVAVIYINTLADKSTIILDASIITFWYTYLTNYDPKYCPIVSEALAKWFIRTNKGSVMHQKREADLRRIIDNKGWSADIKQAENDVLTSIQTKNIIGSGSNKNNKKVYKKTEKKVGVHCVYKLGRKEYIKKKGVYVSLHS